MNFLGIISQFYSIAVFCEHFMRHSLIYGREISLIYLKNNDNDVWKFVIFLFGLFARIALNILRQILFKQEACYNCFTQQEVTVSMICGEGKYVSIDIGLLFRHV